MEEGSAFILRQRSNGEEVFGLWRLVFMVLLWLDDSLGFE
jgi:hypothetical protein